jgi:hypothetical protein
VPGSLDLYDRVDLTAPSESSPRQRAVSILQPHHTAYPSDEGSRRLMDAGGRTVSANGLLLRDGTLVEVVPLNRRAFTSASSFDESCLTVEMVNQTGSPEWGLSDAQHRRMGKLRADMTRRGLGTNDAIVPHNRVPGSYPTACPGPSYNEALIRKYADEYLNDTPIQEEDDMSAVTYYNVPNGTRANIGEFSREFITPETHGAFFEAYSNFSSVYNNGTDVSQGEFDVLAQSAANREAAFLSGFAGIVTGIDPARIEAVVRASIQEAFDNADIPNDSIDVRRIVMETVDEIGSRLTGTE